MPYKHIEDARLYAKLRARAARARDPEGLREQARAYRMSSKSVVTYLLRGARDRAKKKGVPFDLDREFIAAKLERGLCEVTGIPVRRRPYGSGRAHPWSPTLDRRIPALGYTKNNVRLTLYAVNNAMLDWGEEVLIEISRAVVKRYGIEGPENDGR